MTPSQARASLDRMLAGRDLCELQQARNPEKKVTLRAAVRDYKPDELTGGNGLNVGDSHVIISTTEINAAQWPDAATIATATTTDPRIPAKGDRIILRSGRVRVVLSAWAAPYVGGELVRIEMNVR
jgi:hypothetical protein